MVDPSFQAKFKTDAGVKTVVKGLVAHANTFFAHASLTTKLRLERVNIVKVAKNFPAGTSQAL